jgi:hypothetical protein
MNFFRVKMFAHLMQPNKKNSYNLMDFIFDVIQTSFYYKIFCYLMPYFFVTIFLTLEIRGRPTMHDRRVTVNPSFKEGKL